MIACFTGRGYKSNLHLLVLGKYRIELYSVSGRLSQVEAKTISSYLLELYKWIIKQHRRKEKAKDNQL
jgi:hypothetical protein